MNVQDEVFNEENESASNIAEDARMEEPLQVRVSSFLLFTLDKKPYMHYLFTTTPHDGQVKGLITWVLVD